MFVLYKDPTEVPLAQAPERIRLGEEANMTKVHSERYWLNRQAFGGFSSGTSGGFLAQDLGEFQVATPILVVCCYASHAGRPKFFFQSYLSSVILGAVMRPVT
jgi:hypothetical protein